MEASEDLASGSVESSSHSNESYKDEILEILPDMKIPPNKRFSQTFELDNFFDLDLSAKVFKTPDKAFKYDVE